MFRGSFCVGVLVVSALLGLLGFQRNNKKDETNITSAPPLIHLILEMRWVIFTLLVLICGLFPALCLALVLCAGPSVRAVCLPGSHGAVGWTGAFRRRDTSRPRNKCAPPREASGGPPLGSVWEKLGPKPKI